MEDDIEQWQVLYRTAPDEDWIVWDTLESNSEALMIAEDLSKHGQEMMVEKVVVKRCNVAVN